MRAVQDDSQTARLDVEALHAPRQARGGSGVRVDEPGVNRRAAEGGSANAQFAELVEDRAGERDV